MESQYIRSNISGTDGVNQKEVKVANQRTVGSRESLVRILALVLTLVAAIVLGVSKETEIVSIKIIPTLAPIDVPAQAKWHYMSAFVYFLVANCMACAYAAFSLVLSFANRGKNKGLGMVIFFLDLVMVALLSSGIGAATSIGLMAYQGNSHVQWNKVCNVFGKFCHQAAASFVLSFLGSLAFMFLTVLSALGLTKTA